MKKLLTMMLCVCMLAILGACGNSQSDSPKEVTKLFLDAYRHKDAKKIKEYSQWEDFSVKALEIQESDYIDGVDKKLQKKVYEMMQSFEHSEGKESIHDDQATVKVTMKIYDFDPVVEQGLQQATKKAEELSAQSDVSDADAQMQINTILFENMAKAKQTKKKDIIINLVKKDGKWLVSSDNADIQNILIANMQSLQKAE